MTLKSVSQSGNNEEGILDEGNLNRLRLIGVSVSVLILWNGVCDLIYYRYNHHKWGIMNKNILTVCLLFAALGQAFADIVVTRDAVTNFVHIRELAISSSVSVGQLRPGDQSPHSRSVSGWHVVEMPDGFDGFVAKRWTEVFPDIVDLSENTIIQFIDVGTGDSAIIDMGVR